MRYSGSRTKVIKTGRIIKINKELKNDNPIYNSYGNGDFHNFINYKKQNKMTIKQLKKFFEEDMGILDIRPQYINSKWVIEMDIVFGSNVFSMQFLAETRDNPRGIQKFYTFRKANKKK